jgi:hypothetical protein
VGAGLLGLALFGLLDPVITAGESGWSTANTAELVAALVLFVAFGRWECRLSARGGLALLPPALLNQAGFSKGLGTALFFYSGNTAFVLILSYFLQRGLHLTPMQAALEFAPMAAATGVASLSLTSLRVRFGHRVVVGGGVLTVTGLLLALPAAGSGNGLTQLLLLQPGLLLYGLGGGLIAPSIVGLSLAETAPDNAGAASGGLLTTTQAANAIGVAAIGALFNAAYSSSGSYRQAFDVSLGVLSGVFVLTVLLLATFRTSTTAAVRLPASHPHPEVPPPARKPHEKRSSGAHDDVARRDGTGDRASVTGHHHDATSKFQPQRVAQDVIKAVRPMEQCEYAQPEKYAPNENALQQ